MKRTLTTLLVAVIATGCFAQDTLFFDYYNKKVRSINKCYTYEVHVPTGKNGRYTLVTEYKVNGEKKSETVYSNYEKGIKHGTYNRYWENGKLQYTANYNKGKKQGIVESFTVTGFKRRHEEYDKDELMKGTCFDTLGNTIRYFPYEQMPVFGSACKDEGTQTQRDECGERELNNFLDKNLEYPASARQKGVQGKVWAQFYVEMDGAISHVEILTDIGEGCGEEVKRMLESMPPWSPGLRDGIPVKVKFRFPINFTIR